MASRTKHSHDKVASKNSTCRQFGHDWKPTTSDLYRTCTRMNCHVMEHLVQGQWVAVSKRSGRKSHQQSTLASQPIAPWAISQHPLDGLYVPDATAERRALNQYYQLLGR